MNVDKVVPAGEVHRFHFVMQGQMKNEIKKIGKELGLSMHDTIVFMLETMYPILVKWHLMGNEANNKIQKVHWDTKVHVNLDLNFFKRIRLLHTQSNVFSIAIIVRKMLMLFIKHFRHSGLERLRGMIKRFERIHFKKYKKNKKFDKRKIQTQLSRLSSTSARYIVSFNRHYQLLTTQLLQ